MSPVCPATGHFIVRIQGPNCPDHGVPWFMGCPSCGLIWLFVELTDTFAGSELFDQGPERATDFCAGCGEPGPWLSRERLIEWIKHRLQADTTVSTVTRLELADSLDKLRGMAGDDTRAANAWRQLKEKAPKVWDATTKPVRDALIGEAVKRLLGP